MSKLEPYDIPFDDPLPPASDLPPVILDRSTIERYATCPWQAYRVEHMPPMGSEAADSGQEVHRIIASAVRGYATDGVPPRDMMEQELPKARPDVQPDVIEGLRSCIWRIDAMLTSHNPRDIIAYQDGEDDQAGQFAWDLLPATETRGPIRITSEIDLLMRGTTATEVEEMDWKSGHKHWRSSNVRDAFQFQLHAWLIFNNFPEVAQAHIAVWNTRLMGSTAPYTFRRDSRIMEDFTARLTQAVRRRDCAHDPDGVEPETWPSHNKCRICDVVLDCPQAATTAIWLNTDPAAYAQATEVMALALAQRREDLRAYVDAHGEVDLGKGRLFGLGESRRAKRPTLTQYKFYAGTAQDDEDEHTGDVSS